ncbi:MAG: hypothetical protein QXS81_03575 [Candidatus Micrarchaeaceae archaeon]
MTIRKIDMSESFYTNRLHQRLYKSEAERISERIRNLNKKGSKEFLKRINASIKNQNKKLLAINPNTISTLPVYLFNEVGAEVMYSALVFAEEVSALKTVRNEYSEKVEEKTINALAKRIKKLSPSAIDELWFRVGFIYADHGKNKAISEESIKEIKSSDKSARIYLLNLFTETKLDLIKRNIAFLEKHK